jgi:centrosomal protein CEP41
MSKHLAKVEDIQANFRIQKGELFKRLKLSTFAALVLEVDKVNMMNESGEDDVVDDIVERVETTPRQSKFLDVIRGTGELNLKEQNKNLELPPKPKLPKEQTPYSQS